MSERKGWDRGLSVTADGKGLVGHAGVVLLRRLADRVGLNNREKARLKVARAHAKVTDARREFHHQLSIRLISENQGIAVENLSMMGLARTRMAKSVHDAGWAQLLAMLEYKAGRYGRTLVKVGRYEPTTQICSACGVVDGPKPLSVREWACVACGTTHDRDTNAALTSNGPPGRR